MTDKKHKTADIERLEHINGILMAIRKVNQLIVQSGNQEELLQKTCNSLAEARGYFNAWIAILDDDRRLVASYKSGEIANFDSMVQRLEAGDLPSCVRKILDGKPVVNLDDPPKNCADCPLASSYSGRGGISAALTYGGHTYGVLVLSVPIDHIQDSEECDLVAELARDLGYALNKFEQANVLRKSKTLLDATGRMAKVGGWELNAKTRDVEWTDETYRIHEIDLNENPPLEKAIGFFHPEDRPILERALQEALDEGHPYDIELRFTSAKGRALFTRTICTPIMVDGEVVSLQGTFQDITDQKRAEEALRKSEETLRTTFDSIGDAVISTDIEAQVASMNRVAQSLTGWSEEDALGLPLTTVFPIINEETRRTVENPVAKTLECGCIIGLANHTLLLSKDGREIPIADSSAPIRNDAGEITGVVLVFRDQTEDRAAQKKLESSLELLRIAGETAGFGGWTVDSETEELICSDTVKDMLELPRDYAPTVEEGINFFVPEWREKVREKIFKDCAKKGIPFDLEPEVITKNGHHLWARVCGKAIKNEAGTISKVQGSFQDITEKKAAEQELSQFAWLLEKESGKASEAVPSEYGNITELNRDGEILNAVGYETLKTMSDDLMDLLDSCVAVYEKNGDYAFGTFVSSWCGTMDNASRRLCNTADNREALNCGKWLCHDSCWDISKAALDSGEAVDRECNGGLHIYAVPVFCRGEVIGVINFGYGTPPNDPDELKELADTYQIDPDALRNNAERYKPRPPFIIEVAKKRLHSIAQTIGGVVENKRAQDVIQSLKKRNQALLDYSPVCHKIIDLDFNLQFMNRCGFKMLNLEETQNLYGKPYPFNFFPDQCRQELTDAMKQAVKTGERIELETLACDSTGNEAWLYHTILPVKKDDESVDYLTIVTADVTKRKEAEEDLKAYALELEQFNRMAVGRELRMIELKREVNALCRELDRKTPYSVSTVPIDP